MDYGDSGQLGFELRLEDVGPWAASSVDWRQDALAASGVGDGLPLGNVTVDAVYAALAEVGLAPDDIVATLPPLMRPATAATVAIWSLVAGCRPADVPVVVASVEALAVPAFNALGVLTTTGAAAVAVIVNGPAAAGFNSEANLLGPGASANGVVGRAVAFVTRALGAVPGVTDMATMGQPGKYTLCFAENERDSPWEPLHVARGVEAGRSAVTAFAASGTSEVTNMYAVTAQDVLATLAMGMYHPGSLDPHTGVMGGGAWLMLVSPEWATILSRAGLSRSECCAELASRAEWSASTLPPELRQLLSRGSISTLRAVSSPDDITFVVAGGIGIKQTVLSAWPGGSRSVTIEVSSPRIPARSG